MSELESAIEKEIKDSCLRLLVRREHSQRELLDKLALKGFERSSVQIVATLLAEQGWQSDQRFSESYARYRIRKGYGPIKISFELQQRGIDTMDLDAVVADLFEGWDEVIDSVYNKKYVDDKILKNKEWAKRSRFLQQRGFSGEMIKSLFAREHIQIDYT